MKRKRDIVDEVVFKNKKSSKNKVAKLVNSSSDKKSVSWAENCVDLEFNTDKQSTPYPYSKKLKTESLLKGTNLTFDDSDSLSKDDESTSSQISSSEEISTSNWIVTPCTNFHQDFCCNNALAIKIKQNLKEAGLHVEAPDQESNFEPGSFSSSSSIDNVNDSFTQLHCSRVDMIDPPHFIESQDNNSETEQDMLSIFKSLQVPLNQCKIYESEYKNNLEQVPLNQCKIYESEYKNNLDQVSEFIYEPVQKNLEPKKFLDNHNVSLENDSEGNDTFSFLNATFVSENAPVKHIEETFSLDQKNIPESLEKVKKKYDKFNENFEYYVRRNKCIFLIKHPTKLYFHGKLLVSLIFGKIEILGYILDEGAENVPVFSPKGNSFLCFEAMEHNSKSILSEFIRSYQLPRKNINKFIGNNRNVSVFVLENLTNDTVHFLDQNVPQHLYPKLNSSHMSVKDDVRKISYAEYRLQCVFDVEPTPWNKYRSNNEWFRIIQDLLKERSQNYSVFICGGKGVGKSTFLRYAVNQILSSKRRVLCIDLDPGQPEFTVPGCISATIVDEPIIGPNFTHLRKPEKCLFIGDVNVNQCLDHYLQSVRQLLIYCTDNLDKNIPWFVNYMGYTKCFGTDLVANIIKIIQPNFVIQIQSNEDKYNFPSHLLPALVENRGVGSSHRKLLNYTLKVVKSSSYKNGQMVLEPKHIRDILVASYFSQMFDKNDLMPVKADKILHETKDLANLIPYVIDTSHVRLSHVHNTKLPVYPLMNGGLAALCTAVKDFIVCVGFGIIQGIDTDTSKLYVLTPVPLADLRHVSHIISGTVGLPKSFYLKNTLQKNPAYVSSMTIDYTTRIPKRSFIPREGYSKKQ